MNNENIQTDYKQLTQKVFRYAFFKVRNKEKAEDITSETLTRAFADDRFKTIDNPDAWVFGIARNVMHESYRDYLKQPDTVDEMEDYAETTMPEPEQEAITAELTAAVQGYMEQLDESEREAIVLKTWEEMKFSEIAEVMGLSESTVKSKYFRGIAKLKKLADQDMAKEGRNVTLPILLGGILMVGAMPQFTISSGLITTVTAAAAAKGLIVSTGIMAETGTAAAGATAATTTGAAATATSGAASTAATGAAVGGLKGIFTTGILATTGAKVGAGLAAAAIVVTGGVVGVSVLNQPEENSNSIVDSESVVEDQAAEIGKYIWHESTYTENVKGQEVSRSYQYQIPDNWLVTETIEDVEGAFSACLKIVITDPQKTTSMTVRKSCTGISGEGVTVPTSYDEVNSFDSPIGAVSFFTRVRSEENGQYIYGQIVEDKVVGSSIYNDHVGVFYSLEAGYSDYYGTVDIEVSISDTSLEASHLVVADHLVETIRVSDGQGVTTEVQMEDKLVFGYIDDNKVYLYNDGETVFVDQEDQTSTYEEQYQPYYPKISPDNKYLAYIKSNPTPAMMGFTFGNLYIYDINADTVEELDYVSNNFNWTHDSKIYMVDHDIEVVADQFQEGPDGEPVQVAVAHTAVTGTHFVVYNPSTNIEEYRYDDNDVNYRGVAFNSRRNLILTDIDGKYVTRNIKTGETREILDSSENRFLGAWSPSGKYMVFSTGDVSGTIVMDMDSLTTTEIPDHNILGAGGPPQIDPEPWYFEEGFTSYCRTHIFPVDGSEAKFIYNRTGGGCHNVDGLFQTSPDGEVAVVMRIRDAEAGFDGTVAYEVHYADGTVEDLIPNTNPLIYMRWINNRYLTMYRYDYTTETNEVIFYDRDANEILNFEVEGSFQGTVEQF